MNNRVVWKYDHAVGHMGTPTDATMPVWKMPVSKSHKDTQGGGPTKAGYPDFVLYSAPAKGKHSAIAEIKTFWSYKIQEVIDMFRHLVVTNDNRGVALLERLPGHLEIPGQGGGYFDWRNKSDEANIIKQVSSSITSSLVIVLKTFPRFGERLRPLKSNGEFGQTARSYLLSSGREHTMRTYLDLQIN